MYPCSCRWRWNWGRSLLQHQSPPGRTMPSSSPLETGRWPSHSFRAPFRLLRNTLHNFPALHAEALPGAEPQGVSIPSGTLIPLTVGQCILNQLSLHDTVHQNISLLLSDSLSPLAMAVSSQGTATHGCWLMTSVSSAAALPWPQFEPMLRYCLQASAEDSPA